MSPGICSRDNCPGCDSCDRDGQKRCVHEWVYKSTAIPSRSMMYRWMEQPDRECLKCKKKEKFVTVSYWEQYL